MGRGQATATHAKSGAREAHARGTATLIGKLPRTARERKLYAEKLAVYYRRLPRVIRKHQINIGNPPRESTEGLRQFELGRYYEEEVTRLLNRSEKSWRVVGYGENYTGIADQENAAFAADWADRVAERKEGIKRPDILVFEKDVIGPRKRRIEAGDELVGEALFAAEIRSSNRFIQHEDGASEEQIAKYEKLAREARSFVIKSDDFVLYNGFIQKHRVPVYFIQAFDDEIYMIPFLTAVRLVASRTAEAKSWIRKSGGGKLTKREQELVVKFFSQPDKLTPLESYEAAKVVKTVEHYIPISYGKKIGTLKRGPIAKWKNGGVAKRVGQSMAWFPTYSPDPAGSGGKIDHEALQEVIASETTILHPRSR